MVGGPGSPARSYVTLPNGSLGTKDDLSLLLGGADKEMFRNIFAFSLDGSSQLPRARGGEGPRTHLRDTGDRCGTLARGGRAALDAQRSRLLKPRAASEINDLRRSLRETLVSIRDAQRVAASYPKAVREEEDTDTEVDRLSQAWRRAEASAAKYAKLVAVWPDWSEHRRGHRRARGYRGAPGVSLDAAERLDAVLAEIREARRGLKERANELTGHVGRLERVRTDDRLPPVAAEVKDLADRLSVYEVDLQRLSAVGVPLEAEASKLADELKTLGPNWDKKTWPWTYRSRREEVRSWGTRCKEASEQERRLADSTRKSPRAQVSACLTERARLEAGLAELANVRDLRELDQSERTARRLDALLASRALDEAKVDYSTRTLEDRRIMVAASRWAPMLRACPPPCCLCLAGYSHCPLLRWRWPGSGPRLVGSASRQSSSLL